MNASVIAFNVASEDPAAGESSEFALDRAVAQAHIADDPPLIESLVGVTEQEPQHRLPSCAEEGRRDRFCGKACV